jgi:plastocyanin
MAGARAPRAALTRVVGAGMLAIGALVAQAAVPALGADGAVTMVGHSFQPGEVTVVAGTTVTWKNDDSVSHNAVAFDGSFRTEVLAPGDRGSVTFATTGSFSYRCTIHPSMRGAVVVVAAAPAPATDTVERAVPAGAPPAGAAIALLAGAVAAGLTLARPRRAG